MPASKLRERIPFLRPKISATQKVFFIEQLQVMTRAGVPLTSTLRTLEAQATAPHLKEVLNDLTLRIEEGRSLSEALRLHEADFGELMINMIAAGETSGRLEEVFSQIYLQMRKDHEIVSRVRNALIYPIIVVIAMLGIGTGMVVFIIPKLAELFSGSGVKLPLPTRMLLGLSDVVSNHGILILVGLILFIAAFSWTIHQKAGRLLWHRFLLMMPIVGNISRKINMARFARSVSSFLKTDIPIVKTLATTSHVLANVQYQNALMDASERISKGTTLHDVLQHYPNLFNPTMLEMIAVGEQSGALDDILAEAATFYEDEVGQIMSTMPTILEPILMILLGLGVGGMAVAIMLPLYSLTQVI